MKFEYPRIVRAAAIGLLAVVPLLVSCEDASQVQEGANKYDNADKDAMQKQLNDAQQQQAQQQQQQELLKKLQQDCENTPLLEPKDNPNWVADPLQQASASWNTGAILVLADMQVAWGSGGGSGGGVATAATNSPPTVPKFFA